MPHAGGRFVNALMPALPTAQAHLSNHPPRPSREDPAPQARAGPVDGCPA